MNVAFSKYPIPSFWEAHMSEATYVLPPKRHDLVLPVSAKNRGVRLSYLHADPKEFPLGNIGDSSTPAYYDVNMVEKKFGSTFGPIYFLQLAPHDPPEGVGHDVVHIIDKPSDHNEVHVADAMILHRMKRPFACATLVGDCPIVVVTGTWHLGFIHAGRPEVFAGLLPKFFEAWPEKPSKTTVVIGPGIGRDHYEFDGEVPERYYDCRYMTTWGERSFDVPSAISHDLPLGISLCAHVGPDPFAELERGNMEWASLRWYGRHEKKSPRDCAFMWYTPS